MMIDHRRNTAGRDFAVGDIHGMFDMLTKRLAELRFDTAADRLFSVGDLVDRGPASAAALRWLAEPWFYAVRGNHEQMAIDYAAGRLEASLYNMAGGAWFAAMTAAAREPYVEAFERLPIAREIETAKGRVGIVHADCPYSDWNSLRIALADPDLAPAAEEACLWSRDRLNHRLRTPVAGVEAVLVGHSPVSWVTRLGNVMYIDTGAVFRGGRLTLIELAGLTAA